MAGSRSRRHVEIVLAAFGQCCSGTDIGVDVSEPDGSTIMMGREHVYMRLVEEGEVKSGVPRWRGRCFGNEPQGQLFACEDGHCKCPYNSQLNLKHTV